MLQRKSFVAVLACAVLSACGGGGDNGTTNPLVPILSSINVSISPVSIQVGQSAVAAAAGIDQNGGSIATGPVTWNSSATNVATISSTGAITAVAAGTTTIAASAGGKLGQAQLTVTLPPPVLTTLQVSLSSPTIAVQSTSTATATGRDQFGNSIGTGQVLWSSNNTTVATVSASGTVIGLAPGNATITAVAGTISASAAIVVTSAWTPTTSSTLIATSMNSSTPLVNRFGTSAFASLDIICGLSNKLFVLAVQFPHIVSRNGLIAYNGTNIPTTSGTWLEGSTFHSLIHPGPNSATKILANQIASGSEFSVAFGEFNGATQATTFRVAGMTQAMAPLFDACPGANLATPAQAMEIIGELRALRASAAQ